MRPEVWAYRLETADPDEVRTHKWHDPAGNTWVTFKHNCGLLGAGRVDRTLFMDSGGHLGGSLTNCCGVRVEQAWWKHWRTMRELERAVWSVRQEEARR